MCILEGRNFYNALKGKVKTLASLSLLAWHTKFSWKFICTAEIGHKLCALLSVCYKLNTCKPARAWRREAKVVVSSTLQWSSVSTRMTQSYWQSLIWDALGCLHCQKVGCIATARLAKHTLGQMVSEIDHSKAIFNAKKCLQFKPNLYWTSYAKFVLTKILTSNSESEWWFTWCQSSKMSSCTQFSSRICTLRPTCVAFPQAHNSQLHCYIVVEVIAPALIVLLWSSRTLWRTLGN